MDSRQKTPSGYVRVGKRYIAQSFLLSIFFALLALATLYATVLHDIVMRRWYEIHTLPVFKLDSPYLSDYAGEAQLTLADGTVIYEGGMDAAAAEGMGRLYDGGVLVYEGGFSQGLYNGQGTLYYPDGSVKYKGGFEQNLYMGEGVLYDADGSVLYTGPFSNGLYDGLGTLYMERDGIRYTYVGHFDDNTQNGSGKLYKAADLLYDGDFINGVYHGEGMEYENGAVVYTGGFANGLREGYGRAYQNGRVRYEGGFAAARYDGNGRLFDADGLLVYEGGFAVGQYEGEGRLYANGILSYSGEFAAGIFNGKGMLYEGDALVYEGGFANGRYDGAGKRYDRGVLLYEGEFLRGKYNGWGKCYQEGVLIYEGEFADGNYNGNGTEYDSITGFPVFSGKYLDNARMDAGAAFGGNGEPLPAPPAPPADPLSFLGLPYADVVTALLGTGIVLKEQFTDGVLLAVDDITGVGYHFSALPDGTPGFLHTVYYYGLLSADGIVVGTDMGDLSRPPVGNADIKVTEYIIMGFANALTGRNTRVSEMQGAVFVNGKYTITAYYLPPDTDRAAASDADAMEAAEEAESSVPEGVILFLSIELK